MKTSKLILFPRQIYVYKTTYVNPLKLKTPNDEYGIVTIVYEDAKKEKIVHYEITKGAIGEKIEVTELPENIILSDN